MPEKNIPLIRKTLEHIEAHPDEHNQAVWAKKTECGAQFCFAGWAVMLAEEVEPFWVDFEENGTLASYVITSDGLKASIMEEAQKLLGLTECERNLLFMESYTLDELRSSIRRVTGGEVG
jgi:hypothetical protein